MRTALPPPARQGAEEEGGVTKQVAHPARTAGCAQGEEPEELDAGNDPYALGAAEQDGGLRRLRAFAGETLSMVWAQQKGCPPPSL